ncbi:DUF3667 domain-containing protein, partial [Rubrivirga sp.]|uniref:DUF3667 domain-containing protein n=1 Tax=Rubrivirga sp. TaxID=1885344 RepID=UPI003C760D56
MSDIDPPPAADLEVDRPPAVTPEEADLVAEAPTLCLNCGARLPGQFCARCGQKSQELRVPVHRFVARAFQELFGLDGRVWRTYGTLLFKPGRLTTNYFKGRRQRSLSPLRVYIVSTLLFFLLISVLDPVGRIRETVEDSIEGRDPDEQVVVQAELARVEADLARADSAAAA